MPVTDPAIDPCWDAYPSTVLEIGDGPSLSIDLRQPVREEHRLVLAGLGLDRPFAVITACNPRGDLAAPQRNAERNGRLAEALSAAGIAWLPADGVSVDGLHRERGFAVATDAETASRLAARFEQSAIFWFDGRRFSIVPVLEPLAGEIVLPLPDPSATRVRAAS